MSMLKEVRNVMVFFYSDNIECDVEPGAAVAGRAGGGRRRAAGGQRVQRLHPRGPAARVPLRQLAVTQRSVRPLPAHY